MKEVQKLPLAFPESCRNLLDITFSHAFRSDLQGLWQRNRVMSFTTIRTSSPHCLYRSRRAESDTPRALNFEFGQEYLLQIRNGFAGISRTRLLLWDKKFRRFRSNIVKRDFLQTLNVSAVVGAARRCFVCIRASIKRCFRRRTQGTEFEIFEFCAFRY